MLVTDSRDEWSAGELPDPRVRHFWDEERVTGTWFAERDLGGLGYSGIVWDAFFLFGPGASWEDAPDPLEASGATVIGESETLAEAAARLIG